MRNLLPHADRDGGNRVRVLTGVRGSQAFVEVRDDGPAISPEHRDRVFRPFESAGRSETVPSAIGLGLSVSRTLAELMDGTLDYSHDGEWSIFRLELPGTEAPPARAIA